MTSSVRDFLSSMLEYRPSQPLHFAADFFKALDDAEDERLDALMSSAASSAGAPIRKKKDTGSGSASLAASTLGSESCSQTPSARLLPPAFPPPSPAYWPLTRAPPSTT